MRTALITGGSAGLGHALAAALTARRWRVVTDARGTTPPGGPLPPDRVTQLVGDVTDPDHRNRLAELVGGTGLDLLVHNASTLGPDGLQTLSDLAPESLRAILETNLVAPLALTRLVLPALLRSGGTVMTISSDAAAEHYPAWGGYGASKAALDHLAGTLAAEHPELAVYSVDPGDLRTALHQAAFPGQDISDRPLPESVVPALLALVERRPASGRYRLTGPAETVAS